MMAVDLDDRDSLLLSSQFLTEENNILSVASKPISSNWSSCSGSSDFGSALSSPVESELGSTESESDQDDDYIAELTRQMAHYMLQDDDDDDYKHEQAWSVAGSPQSTLCAGLASREEEVPIMGNFEKLQINEETYHYKNEKRFVSTSLEPTSVPLTVRKPAGLSVEFQSKQSLIDDQIRAFQLYKLKEEQSMNQQGSMYWGKQTNSYNEIQPKQQSRHLQTKGRACGGYTNDQKGSWANLQQQQRTGSEMKAVFLGDPGSRSRSCGTGVFLPRGIGNTSVTRKKSGCSTVLIPARVVQALKLHFDKMGTESKSSGAGLFPIQHDALMGDVRYDLRLHRKSQSKTVPAMNYHQETGLPQEWMY